MTSEKQFAEKRLAEKQSGSIRLYVDQPLATGATLEATAGQTRYLGTVMRRASGDRVRLFNGRDGEFSARIATIRRDRASLVVEHRLHAQTGEPDLWLVFALLKRDATDLVVQKATELGATALLPVVTERTIAHRVNEARLAAIAIEASEQCERLTVPRLHPPRPLMELLSEWTPDRRLFVAAERAGGSAISGASGPAGLLVGPEGGFTPAELDAVRAHPFVTAVSLGPRILRAETACIVGLALLQAADCG
jgi:16S rRNA (uracil1498-N3)-methyltransferase